MVRWPNLKPAIFNHKGSRYDRGKSGAGRLQPQQDGRADMSQNFLFIIGTPRSGTTWTQILLAQHPEVATGRETHLFTRYLGPLLDQYRKERMAEEADGLWHYFNQRDFIRKVLGPVLKNVLAELAAQRPGARLVLEKTPSHERFTGVIHEILGKRATVLHVMRDPRAVYASYKAAAQQEWGAWAKQTPEQVGGRWCATQKRRIAMRKLYGDRYREIRYEDLRIATGSELAALLDWLSLPYDADLINQMVAASSLEKLRTADGTGDRRAPTTEARSEFFRSGKTDGWRTELTPAEISAIEQVAGPEMRLLGYEPVAGAP